MVLSVLPVTLLALILVLLPLLLLAAEHMLCCLPGQGQLAVLLQGLVHVGPSCADHCCSLKGWRHEDVHTKSNTRNCVCGHLKVVHMCTVQCPLVKEDCTTQRLSNSLGSVHRLIPSLSDFMTVSSRDWAIQWVDRATRGPAWQDHLIPTKLVCLAHTHMEG